MEYSGQGYSQPLRSPSSMSLSGDEKVIWYGKRCWASLIGKIIMGLIMIIFYLITVAIGGVFAAITAIWLLIIGLVSIIVAVIERIRTEYVFTNHRVYDKYGVIGRKVKEAKFSKITDTSFTQGIIGRLLDYGSISINTAGSAGYEITYKGVKNPQMVNNILRDSLKRREKQDRKQERIDRLKDKLYTGEITEVQFKAAKKEIFSEKMIEE